MALLASKSAALLCAFTCRESVRERVSERERETERETDTEKERVRESEGEAALLCAFTCKRESASVEGKHLASYGGTATYGVTSGPPTSGPP